MASAAMRPARVNASIARYPAMREHAALLPGAPGAAERLALDPVFADSRAVAVQIVPIRAASAPQIPVLELWS